MIKRDSKGYWIWAQFDNSSMKLLNKAYIKTNSKLNGPNFNIHLTISGPIKIEKDIVIRKFLGLKAKLHSFDIKIDNYLFSKLFYESLYISVFSNKQLDNLKENIDKEFNIFKNNYNPHISLFYGKKSDSDKKKIIAELPSLPKTIKLSTLCLVYVDENKNKWDIEHKFHLNN